MKKFWSILIKAGVYGLGHAPAIAQIAVDAANKNIPGVIQDGAALAAQSIPQK